MVLLPTVARHVLGCLIRASDGLCGMEMRLAVQVTAVETFLTELDTGIKSAQVQVVKACEARQTNGAASQHSEEVRGSASCYSVRHLHHI